MSTAPNTPSPDRPTGLGDGSASDDALVVGTDEPAPKVRTGGCECGETRYEVTGDPDDPHACFPDD